MRFKLILAAGAAIFLASSAASLAQQTQDQTQAKDKQDQARGKAGEKGAQSTGNPRNNGGPAGKAAAPAAPAAKGSPRATNNGASNRQNAPAPAAQVQPAPAPQPTIQTPQAKQGASAKARGGQAGQTTAPTNRNAQRPTLQTLPTPKANQAPSANTPFGKSAGAAPRAATPQPQTRQATPQGRTQTARPPAAPLSGWTPPPRGPARDQAGQQWRQSHQGWDNGARWRQGGSWWQGDSAFSLFLGPRVGFFFIPSYGYIAPPQAYRDHRYQPGDYLPSWFWRYRVTNYAHYGLPRPPRGCMWVWVNNNVALIDTSDGYILDMERNIW